MKFLGRKPDSAVANCCRAIIHLPPASGRDRKGSLNFLADPIDGPGPIGNRLVYLGSPYVLEGQVADPGVLQRPKRPKRRKSALGANGPKSGGAYVDCRLPELARTDSRRKWWVTRTPLLLSQPGIAQFDRRAAGRHFRPVTQRNSNERLHVVAGVDELHATTVASHRLKTDRRVPGRAPRASWAEATAACSSPR